MVEYRTIKEIVNICDREYGRIENFIKGVNQFLSNLENELLISEAELIVARHLEQKTI